MFLSDILQTLSHNGPIKTRNVANTTFIFHLFAESNGARDWTSDANFVLAFNVSKKD